MTSKILIIDDNVTYSKLMSILLQKKGYEVTVVDSVGNALKAFGKNDYDVIISDLVMPEEDGVDFLQEVKQNPNTAQIPVIIISGYDTKAHIDGLKNLGAFAVLPKSLKDGNIIPTIEEAIHSIH